MKQTTYNSAASGKIPTLAEASSQVFSPFLSWYQWALDDPSHSARAPEIESAIKNKGRKGSNTFLREGGWKYLLRPLQAWVFKQAIAKKQKLYYVSHGNQALAYFDIDLHNAWQTPEEGQKARQLLDTPLPHLFWSGSNRGLNGYLKVDLLGQVYETANDVFERLEKAVQLYLAQHKNLADFEIKGRIAYLRDGRYVWKQYGKLPIHTPDWNFARLEEFKGKPTVTLHDLTALCSQIEGAIPQEVLQRHKEHKKSLGEKPVCENGYFLVTPATEKALLEKHGEGWRYRFADLRERDDRTWLAECYYRPGQIPITEHELKEETDARNHAALDRVGGDVRGVVRESTQGQGQGSGPCALPGGENLLRTQQDVHTAGKEKRGRFNLDLSDLMAEPDSFKRQREALFRLARYLKRVPTLDESLRLFKEQRLFTGSWSQNETRRRTRTSGTLAFIAESFDAGKCANGSVNVGKYDAWARCHFPNGLHGKNRRGMTENGQIVETESGVHVSPEFIAVFLAVCEFALLTDKNQDGTLPHKRAEDLWNVLYAKGVIAVRFCPRKWAVCREELTRSGVVQITDRNYGPGKAMEWALGRYFPFLGLWKTPRQPGLLGPGEFTTKRGNNTNSRHNTLLRQRSLEVPVVGPIPLPRPPPGMKMVPVQQRLSAEGHPSKELHREGAPCTAWINRMSARMAQMEKSGT